MIEQQLALTDELSVLYQQGSDDIPFIEVMRRFPPASDAALADLIEVDGRVRIRLKRAVTLDRYLGAIPDLGDRPEPLDAAVDMALRALARAGRADERAVNDLAGRHPKLAEAIRDAAALNNAVWSTGSIRRYLTGSPIRKMPCDFGPRLDGGTHRYELRELLGEGAYGQVYMAIDGQLSEEGHPAFVSIKVLSAPGSSRQQLIDEATKARRIDHPNVVRVLDRGVSEDDEDFLVYEYVKGGDLARWVRRHPRGVPVDEAVRIVALIARGVHAAHMAGLVHCDLKPNNIVMTAEGEPKVADFGVAVRAGTKSDDSSVPLGNLAFMSPEQFRMEPGALTIPTDVYALGVPRPFDQDGTGTSESCFARSSGMTGA